MGSDNEKGSAKTALVLLQKSQGVSKDVRAKAQALGGESKKTTYSGNEVKLARSMA